jgi:hypothetical protein
MNSDALIDAVIECATFFELGEDTVIDPDVAVSRLEQVATFLRKMTCQDRRYFCDYVIQKGREEEARYGKTPRVKFLLSIPHTFGLDQ